MVTVRLQDSLLVRETLKRGKKLLHHPSPLANHLLEMLSRRLADRDISWIKIYLLSVNLNLFWWIESSVKVDM